MGTGVAAQASDRARSARKRAYEVRRILARLRAAEAPNAWDVALAEAAVDASRHYRARARRNAAEVRAASIAVSRAAVNQRAALSDLATHGRWSVPAAEPPVAIEATTEPASALPEDGRRRDFPVQRRPQVIEQSPRAGATHELAPERGAPARARRLVRSRCRQLSGENLEVAVLLTSEVVTNAVVHSQGVIRLGIELTDDALRIAVTDGANGEVRLADDFHWPESGHGLRMVEAMSAHWGVDQLDGTGKCVWFELSL